MKLGEKSFLHVFIYKKERNNNYISVSFRVPSLQNKLVNKTFQFLFSSPYVKKKKQRKIF